MQTLQEKIFLLKEQYTGLQNHYEIDDIIQSIKNGMDVIHSGDEYNILKIMEENKIITIRHNDGKCSICYNIKDFCICIKKLIH